MVVLAALLALTAAPGVMAQEQQPTVVSSGEVTTLPEAPGSFRNGSPAPETATPLPLYGLVGAVTLVLGLALRRR